MWPGSGFDELRTVQGNLTARRCQSRSADRATAVQRGRAGEGGTGQGRGAREGRGTEEGRTAKRRAKPIHRAVDYIQRRRHFQQVFLIPVSDRIRVGGSRTKIGCKVTGYTG